LGVIDRFLTASEVGWDSFVGRSELHAKPLSSVLQNLGAVSKLRKVTVSFVMSVRPSILKAQFGCHWMDFCEIWYMSIFRKSV
jgi:hypothetical protein